MSSASLLPPATSLPKVAADGAGGLSLPAPQPVFWMRAQGRRRRPVMPISAYAATAPLLGQPKSSARRGHVPGDS